MPTLQEIKDEIEKGELAEELAPFWADVFNDYPDGFVMPDFELPPFYSNAFEAPREETAEELAERTIRQRAEFEAAQTNRFNNLQERQGKLKPDAAYAIQKVLIAPRYTVPVTQIPRDTFFAALSPLLLTVTSLADETKRNKWKFIMDTAVALLSGGSEAIDIGRPQIQGIFAAAVTDEILTVEQVAAIASCGGTQSQSHCQRRGWGMDVSPQEIMDAKVA